MPSYTTSLRLVQPATGEYSGTWGTQVNNGITALVDAAVAGTVSITMTAANYTLSNNNGTSDEARAMFLVLGGTPGASYQVICPAVSKLYFVTNNTGFAQTVKTASGSGISVPNGASMTLRCDGTNVVEALNAFGGLTLNGGTANGVAYLNASKTLTTGSLLAFSGTDLVLGAPAPSVNVGSSAVSTGSCAVEIGVGRTGNGYSFVDLVGDTTYSDYGLRVIRNNGGANTASSIVHRGTGDLQLTCSEAAAISFTTSGGEKMRLDASGNLGLGVTPSAWSGGFKALEMSNGSVSINANGPYVNQNAIFDTAWKYKANGFAAQYSQIGGVHAWFTAPSGTAGNAISFTQAMTLDANGVLILNTANSQLNVGGSAVSTGDCRIEIGSGRTGNGNAYIDLVGDTTYTDYGLRIIRNNGGANTASTITHRGTNSLQLACEDAGNITFATNGAGNERARITSAGDFIVGSAIVSGPGAITMASITSGFALVNNNNAAATGYVFESFRRSSLEIGSITQNGTTAVLFNTTSDRRLKDNIVPAPSASAVIDAIEIVSHDWKAAPDEHVTYGVIAQDLALVAPQAVLQGDNGNEIEKTWGVDYSKLVPMLIKEIQSLRARVAALEAK